jgi:hypothetical protein
MHGIKGLKLEDQPRYDPRTDSSGPHMILLITLLDSRLKVVAGGHSPKEDQTC